MKNKISKLQKALIACGAISAAAAMSDAVRCGDAEGHPFRGNKFTEAMEASHEAQKASDAAHKSPSDAAHEAAKDAHANAAALHGELAGKAALEGHGGSVQELMHKTLEQHHNEMAADHEQKQSGFKFPHGRYGDDVEQHPTGVVDRKDEHSKIYHAKAAMQAKGEGAVAPGEDSTAAWKATERAHNASTKAFTSGDPKDHAYADKAHMSAARMWRNNGDEGLSRNHINEADVHESLTKGTSRKLSASSRKASDAVRAAGNPAGAAAGHATRKGQAAADASQAAHDASQAAHDSGDDADHDSAAEAHKRAADAHQDAMVAAAKAGRTDDAKYHADMMSAHEACADAHCSDDDDDDEVEACMKTVADLIKAGDVPGHDFHGNQYSAAAAAAEKATADANAKNTPTAHEKAERAHLKAYRAAAAEGQPSEARGKHLDQAGKHATSAIKLREAKLNAGDGDFQKKPGEMFYAEARDKHLIPALKDVGRPAGDEEAIRRMKVYADQGRSEEFKGDADYPKAMAATKALQDGGHGEALDKYHASFAVNDRLQKARAAARGVRSSAQAALDPDAVHCRAHVGARISAAKPWRMGEEASFMFMPAGVTTVTAGFRDGAINLTIEVDEDTARVVQASYERMLDEAPKQRPFCCFEHREEEASFLPARFEFGEHAGEQGVLVAGEPTELGATNVNGKIHRSFSPSFTTDAEYSKATERNGVLVFPEGVRGSRTNPARVTGLAFCCGTLTNKPAFRNMSPVRARQPERQAPPATLKDRVDAIFAKHGGSAQADPKALRQARVDQIFSRLGGAGSPQA